MIPRTYPTLIDGRKAGYMRVFYLTSVTGLTKWIDYIPVKTVAFSAAAEGTTNANGHINVVQVASSTALRRWVDYIPVFEDGAATVPWSTNANGYIPVDQMLDLDFRAGILDSRITFTRADASTCATYFDSTGRLQLQGRNELWWSEDLLNAVWTTRTNCTAVQGAAAPDGTATAWTITASGTNAAYQQVATGSATTAYTSSMWVRRKSGTGAIQIRAAELAGTTISVTSTWTRFSVTNTSTTTTIRCAILMTNADDAVEVWHPQLELGSTATTYSATTTAANSGPRFDYDPASPAGVTGPELVTNGGFDTATGWTLGTNTTIANGAATTTGVTSFAQMLSQSITVTQGKTYRFSISVTKVSGNSIALGLGAQNVILGMSGSQTYTADVRVTGATGALLLNVFEGNGVTWVGSVDNISVQEVTFNPRGLLIEESRQNLLLQSRDMTQAAWTKTDVTPTRNQVGIDGVANTACLMIEGSAGTAATLQLGAAVTAGSTMTQSIVAKRGNTDWVRFRVSAGADGCDAWFNLNTGAKGTVSALGVATSTSSTITNLGGGWYRLTVTCVPNGTFTQAQMQINSASADASGTRVSGATYIVDCAQLEVGAFATSIIPTTTTALTRAADSASMTGTNFSSWFNASAGTFVAEYSVPPSSTANQFLLAASVGGLSSNRHQMIARLAGGTASEAATVSGGAATADMNSAQGSAGTTSKSAYSFAVNDFALSVNGAAALTDTAGALPVGTVDQMRIGSDWSGAFQINSYIRSLRFYPTRLANATLQALTA